MTAFRFQDPFWILMLIPLVLLAWWAVRRNRRTAVLFSDISLLKTLPVTAMQQVKKAVPWLRVLGLVLVILALARPQKGRDEFRVRTEGIAMEMCIDRSGSMQAMDFQIDGKRANRLDAVKKVFRDFVAGGDDLPGRPDDLIGLVVFGGYADAKCPLTLDHGALLEVLKATEIPKPIHDRKGRVVNEDLLQEEMMTAIGDAIMVGVDRLKDSKAKSKVIVLLSDGKHNIGAVTPEEAAEAAKEYGIKVYTIGVGSTGMAPFPAEDAFGRKLLIKQPVELDETTLRQIAKTTGGKYFNAKNTKTLESIYGEIDKLEKTKSEGKLYTEYRELYQWFMLPGLALVLSQVVLSSTRFRSLP